MINEMPRQIIEVGEQVVTFDFTRNNDEVMDIHPGTDGFQRRFYEYVERKLDDGRTGIGKYAEKREIYKHSSNFISVRDIHLGLDIFTDAGTPIYSPYAGRIQSFAYNEGLGDYGGTIIVRYEIKGEVFHILFGHLSRASLQGLEKGMAVSKGQKIAELGSYDENGQWYPHLHLQMIKDMQGLEGDYKGVCSEENKEFYLSNCPDPSFLIQELT